jgi:hypothetical protein
MSGLLGHGVANNDERGICVSERGSAKKKTGKCGVGTRLFVEGQVGRSESGLPGNGIRVKGRVASVLTGVSHINPAACSVTASGPNRRPAARRSSAFTDSVEILFGSAPKRFATNPP